MVRIAMIGTRGVPARYGGFETAIEEIGSRLVDRGHRVTVYCRNEGQTQTEHLGMELVNLPALRRKSLETLSHTATSIRHARRHRPDAAIVFNAANAPFLGQLRRAGIPTAVHMDGLEWKRAKWKGVGARYYKWAERKAACSGATLIADAQGIADYLESAYGRPSTLISYGAPILEPSDDRLAELDLQPQGYHLVVARMEPENHVLEIVRGYARARSTLPLVVVGSAPYGDEYIASIRNAAEDSEVRFTGAVWDQDLLNQLYAHCRSYLHGHSVGGTNPSLLRAMGCGAPVTAFEVSFNREVTGGLARFFADCADVAEAIAADEVDPGSAVKRGVLGQEHVAATYRWDQVALGYEQMVLELTRTRARHS